MIWLLNWTRFQSGSYLVNRSSILSLVPNLWAIIMSAAMHSISHWNHMSWWFLLSWDLANEEFLYKNSLSHKTFAAPSIGTQIILNLYLNETIKSIVIYNAMNSAQKLEFSTVFSLLEYHIIGAGLQYKTTPVWYLRVALSTSLS